MPANRNLYPPIHTRWQGTFPHCKTYPQSRVSNEPKMTQLRASAKQFDDCRYEAPIYARRQDTARNRSVPTPLQTASARSAADISHSCARPIFGPAIPLAPYGTSCQSSQLSNLFIPSPYQSIGFTNSPRKHVKRDGALRRKPHRCCAPPSPVMTG